MDVVATGEIKFECIMRSVLEMLVLVLLPRKFVKILFFFFLFNSLELDKTMR